MQEKESYLSGASFGRCTGYEIRVYYFVWLNTFGCFEIIQMYATMVAHLRLAGATPPTRSHVVVVVAVVVLLVLLLLRRNS